jgi:GTPase SAR1 family protein
LKEVIQQSGQDDPDHVYTELSKHIGEHLKPLAFVSLPVLDAPTEVQNPQSKSDVDKPSLKRLRNRGSEPSLPSGWDDQIQSIDLGFHDPPISDMHGQELDDPQYRLVLELGGDWLEWDIIPLPPHNPLEDAILKDWVNAGGGLRQNDIVIAVMGCTGVGKSTFISHFCPNRTGRVNTISIGTTTVEAYAAVIDDQPVFFLDTPGFDDAYRSDTDILRELADWLNRSYQAKIKLAGILYLHRISDPRISGSSLRNLRMFRRLCGEDRLPCVVLATTFWDRIPTERAVLQEKKLMESDEFWRGMIEKGSHVFRQDNGVTSALRIIRYILSRRLATTLQIQEEMASGKSLDETEAGLEVQAEMERMRAEYAQELQRIKEEMEESLKLRDIEYHQEIAKYKADLESRIKGVEVDGERLKVNMKQLVKQRDEELRQEEEKIPVFGGPGPAQAFTKSLRTARE